MIRRLLIFVMAFCVLVGAAPLPAATVTLVCRMTGQPMQPILHADDAPQARKDTAATEARMPCCVVHVQRRADGEARFTFRENSCCEMRVTSQNAPTPASLPFISGFEMALPPEVAAVVISPQIEFIETPPTRFRPSTPRAPPHRLAFLRAPPVLS